MDFTLRCQFSSTGKGKKFEILNLDRKIRSPQQETELIGKDQARLRENTKALRGSPEEKALPQRYTREVDSQEERLAALRKEISELEAKHARLQVELDPRWRCKSALMKRRRILPFQYSR